MFISIRDKIKTIVEQYDKYGEYRINALKGVYVFFILCAINMIFGITDPYFNYFYLPLTALTAEMLGDTIQSKYWLFFHATMGAIVSVFLFNIVVPYPLFFVGFVFVYSFIHYIIALHYIKNVFIPLPIALSLAIYSLAYGEINTDVYIALNNALISFIAMLAIMGALLLFPRYYYFKAWRRAYILLLREIVENFSNIQRNQPAHLLLRGHFVKLIQYTHLLPHKFPCFSILKINLLINELRVLSGVIDQKKITIGAQELSSLINSLDLLIESVEKNVGLLIEEKNITLQKIIRSWNYVCSQA